MGGQSRINTQKWEMSSYKILSWPKMIMHTVGSTDIQSTTCSARGKQCCWQDGSSRQKINLLCKISKSSYILQFDYGLWALPSNPVSQVVRNVVLEHRNAGHQPIRLKFFGWKTTHRCSDSTLQIVDMAEIDSSDTLWLHVYLTVDTPTLRRHSANGGT